MTPAQSWKYAKRASLLFLIGLPLGLFATGIAGPRDLRITQAFHDLDLLRQIIASYRERQGTLPPDEAGLKILVQQNLLDHRPVDPWGQEYVYRRANNTLGYVLYSPGANGIDEGGAGDDITDHSKYYACNPYGLNCPLTGKEWIALAGAILALTGLLGFFSFGCIALYGRLIRHRLAKTQGEQ